MKRRCSRSKTRTRATRASQRSRARGVQPSSLDIRLLERRQRRLLICTVAQWLLHKWRWRQTLQRLLWSALRVSRRPATLPWISLVATTIFQQAEELALGGGGASGGAGGVGAERDGGLLDADDADGYMRLRVGEILGGRYLVLGVRGRGMFSSVLHCKDMQASASALSESAAASAAAGGYESAVADALGGAGFETTAAPVAIGASGALRKTHAALATGSYATVAVKVLRANDVMRRAGEKEVDILRTLATADPHGRYHCVKLLHFFDHCGHLCLAFEPLEANLKEVQDKFGAGVGLP